MGGPLSVGLREVNAKLGSAVGKVVDFAKVFVVVNVVVVEGALVGVCCVVELVKGLFVVVICVAWAERG